MNDRVLTLLGFLLASGVVIAIILGGGAGSREASSAADGAAAAPAKAPGEVSVRVFDSKGTLVGPITMPSVGRTEAEWRTLLTGDQFQILRESGTERAGTGALLHNESLGVYTCAGCALPLFTSDAKFESGSGWPSFFRPIAKENVATRDDRSHGMVRGETLCARCGGHLGHVFDDGPAPTGLRYCMNSAALAFTPQEQLGTLADPAASSASAAPRAAAVFAGGCFWCVEAVFEELDGVIEVVSGYAGGTKETANYQAVGAGRTNHAEAVRITYDPSKITFVDLLRVHFATHDPTQENRQGPDVGRQYRSAVFCASDEERALATAMIEDLEAQKVFERKIVTTLEPLAEFYEAEPYHQNYVCNNPSQGYVRSVALPKVEKVRKLFEDKLKKPAPAPSAQDPRE